MRSVKPAVRGWPLVCAVAAVAAGGAGCGGPALVALLDNSKVPVTLTPHESVPLEVITRKSGSVPDPLPVANAHIAFGDVETALGHAVASATVPWAEKHAVARPEGWQLVVDLVEANARRRGEEVEVGLLVRATLRTRSDHRYLGQTQAHCKRSAAVEPSGAAPVVFDCMARVGRELAGWLGSVSQ